MSDTIGIIFFIYILVATLYWLDLVMVARYSFAAGFARAVLFPYLILRSFYREAVLIFKERPID